MSAECGRAADQTTHSPEGIIGRERTGTDRHTRLYKTLWAKPPTRELTQFVCLLCRADMLVLPQRNADLQALIEAGRGDEHGIAREAVIV